MSKLCRKYKKVCLPLWEIWKKIHVTNDYTTIGDNNISWRVSAKFKLFFRLCFVCYAVALIVIYATIIPKVIIDASGNLFYVLVNLVVLISPLIVIEFAVVFLVPIEITKDNSIEA